MTRKDAFGLLRAAVSSAVMFIAGAVIPIVGALATMLAPVPLLAFAVARPNALLRGAVAIALAAGLIAVTGGLIAAGAFVATAGLATAIMTCMLGRRYPFETITLCTTAAMIVAGAAAAVALTGSIGGLADGLRDSLTQALANGQRLYRSAGLDTVLPPDTQAEIIDGTIKLFPALAALSAAITVLLNLALFWRWTGRQERAGYP